MMLFYGNTAAEVKRLEMTPLGMVLVSDISNFPAEELGFSDARIAIRLKLIDGSEQVITSQDPEEPNFTQSSMFSFWEADGVMYQRDTIEFTNAINIGKVLGIYVGDLYIPLKSDTL